MYYRCGVFGFFFVLSILYAISTQFFPIRNNDKLLTDVLTIINIRFLRFLYSHLLTYPLKQANNPPILPSNVRMRPSRRVFETEYPLDPYGDNFDTVARGDSLASRTRLKSTEVSFKAVHTIGIVEGNTLHLAPITSIQQLRPDMSHLDIPAAANENNHHHEVSSTPSKRNSSGGVSSSSLSGTTTNNPNPAYPSSSPPSNGSGDPVRVTTTFRRAVNDERVEAFRRATYAFHTAQEEADNFVNLQPHDAVSPLAKHIKTKLTESTSLRSLSSPPSSSSSSSISLSVDPSNDETKKTMMNSHITAEQYLRATANRGILSTNASGIGVVSSSTSVYDTMPNVPIPHGTTVATSAASAGTITLSQLLNQPLTIQIEEILRRSHAVPFHRLLEFTTAATSLQEILSTLDKIGRYVRDCWVLKSDIFYQPHWSQRTRNIVGASGGGSTNSSSSARPRGRPLHSSHTNLYAGLKPSVISRLQLLRDYVLCLFNRSPMINLDDIIQTIGSDEEIRILIAILEALAVQETPGSRVWVWKRYLLTPVSDSPRDDTRGGNAFAIRFPQEVERAQRYWKRRETELLAQFSQHFHTAVSDPSDHGEMDDTNDKLSTTYGNTTTVTSSSSLPPKYLPSSSSSSSSRTHTNIDMDQDTNETIDASITTTNGKPKHRSLSASSSASMKESSTPNVPSSSSSSSPTSDADPLPPIIKTEIGLQIINRMPSVAYQHLRGFIIDTLSQRGICTRGYLLRQIWLQRETDPPKAFYVAIATILKTTVPKLVINHPFDHQGTGIAVPEGIPLAINALNSLLADIAVEIPTVLTIEPSGSSTSTTAAITGGLKRSGSANSNSSVNNSPTVIINNEPHNDDLNGAVISSSSGDISTDQYRPIFIRQLLRQPRSRRTDIRRAIENTLGGQDPSGIIYNKIFKEVAVSSNNVWNIKSGEEDPPIIVP